MDLLTGHPFDCKVFCFLTGLIAAALFFTMHGVKELKMRQFEGILYIAMSGFFLFANILFIVSSGSNHSLLGYIAQISVTGWVIILFAPALIFLYLLFGLFNFARYQFTEGAIKIFIGVAMVVLLYTLGPDWPELVKVSLIIVSSIIWFSFELTAVDEFG